MSIVYSTSLTKAIYKCQRCNENFEAKIADRKRGWARFCSKSCKAIKQTYGKDAFQPEREQK
jgi:DNA replicative helicase MCM subunit Mcm2 (Cdc46/Mcm family)